MPSAHPLTANAVKASLERHLSPDNKDKSRALAANIAQMSVNNPTTMTFHTDRPVARVSIPAGDRCRDDHRPAALRPLPGAQGTYEAFTNQELDVAFLREPQVVATARSEGFADLPTLFGATEAVTMNSGAGTSTAPITSDVRIRRAVAAAIDVNQLNQRVFDGKAIASTTLVPDSAGPAFADLVGLTYDPATAQSWSTRSRPRAGTAAFGCWPTSHRPTSRNRSRSRRSWKRSASR
jgi:ABC-type transport system substrate-binding protein